MRRSSDQISPKYIQKGDYVLKLSLKHHSENLSVIFFCLSIGKGLEVKIANFASLGLTEKPRTLL